MRSTAAAMLREGYYTVPAAARLTGLPTRKVYNWLRGYERGGVSHEPVWRPRYSSEDGLPCLGFLDLQQLRFIGMMRARHVGLQTLREVLRITSSEWGLRHPFASAKLRTLGRTFFLEVSRDEDEEPALIELFKDQRAWHRILSPFLDDVEYGCDGFVSTWFPHARDQGVDRRVIVTPELRFGRPICRDSKQETAVLAAAVSAGETPRATAWWYEVSEAEVRASVRFEELLDRRDDAA